MQACKIKIELAMHLLWILCLFWIPVLDFVFVVPLMPNAMCCSFQNHLFFILFWILNHSIATVHSHSYDLHALLNVSVTSSRPFVISSAPIDHDNHDSCANIIPPCLPKHDDQSSVLKSHLNINRIS